MSAIPMTLQDALSLSGYTIDLVESDAATITTPDGVIAVPPMVLSTLTWHGGGEAPRGAALYLDRLPCFDPAYAPVQLSMILDRFRMRRLAYDTPDEFALAVRRWGNTHLGPMSTIHRLYRSTAVDLPLNTVDMIMAGTDTGNATTTVQADETGGATTSGTGGDTITTSDTTTSTGKGRNASSEFPDAMLAGDGAYASEAVDSATEGTVTGGGTTTSNGTTTGTATTESHKTDTTTESDTRTESRTEKGRNGVSAMALLAEQRDAFMNVDLMFLDAAESLFLGVWDQPERGEGGHGGFYGSRPWGW